MKAWKRQHYRFVALLVGIFCVSGGLAIRYERAWDVTFNQRNQLSETSVALVKQLQAPVHVTAFSRGNPKVKALISRLLRRYQRHGAIHWTFKNPDTAIDSVRQYGITRDGELLLTYQDNTVRVSTLNETAISRGIYRLLQGKTRQVIFAAGRGERGFSEAGTDFSQLKARLQRADIHTLQLDLSAVKTLPDDCDLLVLAAPKHPYSEEEVATIASYLRAGGRLLWLASQAPNSAQPALSRLLGARFVAGTLMGAQGKTYGLDDSTYVPIIPTTKDNAPILAGIDTLLVWVKASPVRQLPTESAQRWQAQVLLSLAGKWLLKQETTIKNAPKPLVVGMALTPADVSQRAKVWLLGDADFASNRFIGQGENGDFAVNVIRQLAAPDVGHILIANEMPPPVVISEKHLAYLALATGIGVPLGILLLGGWWRRRGRQ